MIHHFFHKSSHFSLTFATLGNDVHSFVIACLPWKLEIIKLRHHISMDVTNN